MYSSLLFVRTLIHYTVFFLSISHYTWVKTFHAVPRNHAPNARRGPTSITPKDLPAAPTDAVVSSGAAPQVGVLPELLVRLDSEPKPELEVIVDAAPEVVSEVDKPNLSDVVVEWSMPVEEVDDDVVLVEVAEDVLELEFA